MKTLYGSLATLVLGASTCAAQAGPTIQSTNFFTDHWGPSVAFSTLDGDYLHLFTTVNSPDAPADVSAVATQGALVRPLNFYTTPIFAEKNFERFLTNTSLTGAWDLVATDTSGSANGTFAAIADPELLPLVLNVQVAPGGLTPTVSWTLPDLTGFDVDGFRVRAVVANTSSQTFESALLASSTTSFTLPTGVLTAGVGYEFRILMDDLEGNRLENRSNTFAPVYTAAAPVPEPGSLALMLAGLGAVVGAAGFKRRT
jgi:hypothetical protein